MAPRRKKAVGLKKAKTALKLPPSSRVLMAAESASRNYHAPRRLVRTGNSLALVIDREMLRRTGIGPKTSLQISTDGHVIVISPRMSLSRAERLKQITERLHQEYGEVFQALAK